MTECRLLTACLAAESNATWPAPADSEAWYQLARLANAEGLPGLVRARARARGILIPPTIAAELHNTATIVGANNLVQMSELRRLHQALRAADIEVVVLKGAGLLLSLYESFECRPMSDLDLLVRPEDAERALHVLQHEGCRPGQDLICDDYFPRFYYETELIGGSIRPVRIDLHAHPFRPLRYMKRIPAGAFLDESVRIQRQDFNARMPRPELMLLHLCAHAAFHGGTRIIWLFDILHFVERFGDRLDWDCLLENAREWGLCPAVRSAIAATTSTFGPFMPPSVASRIANAKGRWQDRLILRQAPRDAGRPVRHLFINWLTTPGVRFPARYLLAHLLPGRRHLGKVYPYRHFGWIACAHFCRFVAAAIRPVRTVWHKFGLRSRALPVSR